MSIESLCSQDSVIVQNETVTTDAAGGVRPTYTNGATLKCFPQPLSGREILDYAARGQKITHQIFFSSDPGLSNNQRLVWPAGGLTLRVNAVYPEGRPGQLMLWVVLAENVTTRGAAQ